MTRARGWTATQDDYLRLAYGVVPVRRLQDRLGRGIDTIDARAAALGLPPRRRPAARGSVHVLYEPYEERRRRRLAAPLQLPVVVDTGFLRPPTRAQLMAGR